MSLADWERMDWGWLDSGTRLEEPGSNRSHFHAIDAVVMIQILLADKKGSGSDLHLK